MKAHIARRATLATILSWVAVRLARWLRGRSTKAPTVTSATPTPTPPKAKKAAASVTPTLKPPLNYCFSACGNSSHTTRAFSRIRYLIVHRIGAAIGTTAPEIALWFRSHEEGGTGLKMPYHYIVRADGQIDQALELTRRGMHARKYNSSSVGIACVGDFRRHPPTPEQAASLKSLLVYLTSILPEAEIARHDALPGASGDPNKVCPGPMLVF